MVRPVLLEICCCILRPAPASPHTPSIHSHWHITVSQAMSQQQTWPPVMLVLWWSAAVHIFTDNATLCRVQACVCYKRMHGIYMHENIVLLLPLVLTCGAMISESWTGCWITDGAVTTHDITSHTVYNTAKQLNTQRKYIEKGKCWIN